MLLLQSPVLLFFFFLLLLLVAQVAVKVDIREGGVACGSFSSRIVAGAAASRRGGGSDAAWQLNGSLEQSTSNQGPLTSLLYTLAFFLYTQLRQPTHTYTFNERPQQRRRFRNDERRGRRSSGRRRRRRALRTPDSGDPKVPLLSDVDGWRGGKFSLPF